MKEQMNNYHSSIDIVIVNWNSGSLLRKCIESIVSSDDFKTLDIEVFVVDNDSTDDSQNSIQNLSEKIHLICNKENKGFAFACNQGASLGNGDYVLFLNPDAALNNETILKVTTFMEQPKNSSVGICGVQLLGADNKVSRSCSRFPTILTLLIKILGLNYLPGGYFHTSKMEEWDHADNRFVDQVIGAFFFVRRSLFNALGGFDDRFFVYYEEVDFSYRSNLAGFKSYFLTTVQSYHKGGGTSDQVKALRLFYSIRSRILYAFKHFNIMVALVHLIISIFIEPVARVFLALMRGSCSQVLDILHGCSLVWLDMPHFLLVAWKMRKL